MNKFHNLFAILFTIYLVFSVQSISHAENVQEEDSDRFIITFLEKPKAELMSSIHIKDIFYFDHKYIAVATLSKYEFINLAMNPIVESIERDKVLKIKDLQTNQVEWPLLKINADKAWSDGLNGAGQNIAVLDTGISLNHDDIVVKGAFLLEVFSGT